MEFIKGRVMKKELPETASGKFQEQECDLGHCHSSQCLPPFEFPSCCSFPWRQITKTPKHFFPKLSEDNLFLLN